MKNEMMNIEITEMLELFDKDLKATTIKTFQQISTKHLKKVLRVILSKIESL